MGGCLVAGPGSSRADGAAPASASVAAPPSALPLDLDTPPPGADSPRRCAAAPRCTNAPDAPAPAPPPAGCSAPPPPTPPATSGTTARSPHSPRGNGDGFGDGPDHAPAAPAKTPAR